MKMIIQYNNKIMLLEGDLASGAPWGGFVERLALQKTNVGGGFEHRSAQLASDKLPAYLQAQSGRKAVQS